MALSSFRWIHGILAGAALTAVGSIAVSIAGTPSWAQGDTHLSTKIAPDTGEASAQVARGRYIATAADCVACHTASDGQPFAGGLPLQTPFGTLLSSNITSDKQTGIGTWTEPQFDAALRKGEGRNGHLYPAMPYTAYTKMSDTDVADLWAYMRSVAPVSNAVKENQLPFPFSMRGLLIVWNWLFFHEGRFQPNPAASSTVNRGAYLSEALEHCGACHTPKNLFGADRKLDALKGATLQAWYAPDLTNNGYSGLGHWSAGDLATYLKTGSNRFTVASGPMGEAIVNSTQHLSDVDLEALAAYFKGMPPQDVEAPGVLQQDDPRVVAGRQVYAVNCTACHGASGQAVKGMIPSLADNPAIVAKDPTTLLHIVLKGTQGTATDANPTGAGMPRFDWKLNDQQVADTLTYIRNQWGHAATPVTASRVAKMRQTTGAQAVLVAGS